MARAPRKPTNAARLSELMCKRFYAKDGITLPLKFWNDERYARDFRLGMIKASALLKLYSFECIWNVLHGKEGSRIWSLNAKWLDPLLALEKKRLEQLQQKLEDYQLQKAAEAFAFLEETIFNTNTEETEKSIVPTKKSLLDKLDE